MLCRGSAAEAKSLLRFFVIQQNSLLQADQEESAGHDLSCQCTDYNQVEHTRGRLEGTIAHQFPGEAAQDQRDREADENTQPADRDGA